MYEFKYQRPTSVRQAVNMLAKDSEAKILAGGHSLLPVMKLRLAKPSQIVDIGRIEGLNTIELKGRSIVIGVPSSSLPTTMRPSVWTTSRARSATAVIFTVGARSRRSPRAGSPGWGLAPAAVAVGRGTAS